uniref:Radical SAM protein n=1 Tax=Brugia timori TaxID=42155 RepID=A0A0R3RCW4_9BILA
LIVGKHTDSLILPSHQTTITERLISIIPILEQIQSLEAISEIHEFWNNRGHRTDVVYKIY